MNHDRIEVEFMPENPVNYAERKVLVLSDSRAVRHSIQSNPEEVRHYTHVYGEAGTLVHTNMVAFPWHRIYEIRYYGEH